MPGTRWKVRSWRSVQPIAAACALSLGAASAARAQTPHVMQGIVSDSATGAPLRGAEVALSGTPWVGTTDDRGVFRVTLGSTGVRELRVRRLGYRPLIVTLQNGADDGNIRIGLTATSQALPRVVVRAARTKYTGRLAGYYERLEKRTIGQFISRADIEREHPRQVTELLQRSPGIQVVRGRGQTSYNIRMRGKTCWPLVWLDGVAMGSGDVDIDAFSPTSLEGIELYLGANSAPGQFQAARGKSECGTVLLWSRGPDTDPIRQGVVSPAELERMIASLTLYTAEEVDRPAVMDSARSPAVEYPQSLRAAAHGGVVVAEFVVNEGGGVELENFGVVSSPDPLFTEAVREALRTAVYHPAMRKGEAVRQLVRQPFEFVPPAR